MHQLLGGLGLVLGSVMAFGFLLHANNHNAKGFKTSFPLAIFFLLNFKRQFFKEVFTL